MNQWRASVWMLSFFVQTEVKCAVPSLRGGVSNDAF